MKRESALLYKILSIIFFIAITCLIIANLSIYKQMNALKLVKQNSRNIKPNIIKRYGYSEAIRALDSEQSIEVVSLYMDSSQKNLLKAEARFKGSLEEFQRTVDKLGKEDNFYNISNIKIDNINEEEKNISFELYLIKNK